MFINLMVDNHSTTLEAICETSKFSAVYVKDLQLYRKISFIGTCGLIHTHTHTLSPLFFSTSLHTIPCCQLPVSTVNSEGMLTSMHSFYCMFLKSVFYCLHTLEGFWTRVILTKWNGKTKSIVLLILHIQSWSREIRFCEGQISLNVSLREGKREGYERE